MVQYVYCSDKHMESLVCVSSGKLEATCVLTKRIPNFLKCCGKKLGNISLWPLRALSMETDSLRYTTTNPMMYSSGRLTGRVRIESWGSLVP